MLKTECKKLLGALDLKLPTDIWFSFQSLNICCSVIVCHTELFQGQIFYGQKKITEKGTDCYKTLIPTSLFLILATTKRTPWGLKLVLPERLMH